MNANFEKTNCRSAFSGKYDPNYQTTKEHNSVRNHIAINVNINTIIKIATCENEQNVCHARICKLTTYIMCYMACRSKTAIQFNCIRMLCVTFLSTLLLVWLKLLLLFSRLADVVRGSDVTTIDGGRLCGAANAGGFGNELDTGRHTQANIFVVLCN